MFTVRIDKTLLDFYDELAEDTNRSRNEVINIALEFAMSKVQIEKKNTKEKNEND